MKLWKDGLIGGIIMIILYLVLNLALTLSGNPQYQSMVDIRFYKNIPTMIILFIIGVIVGLIIGFITSKIKKKNNKREW